MTRKTTCQAWCDDHRESGDECYTSRCVYAQDRQAATGSDDPNLSQFAAGLHDAGFGPDQIDSVHLEASFFPNEEDEPEITLQFWDLNKDEPSAILVLDPAGLCELQLGLAAVIGEFSSSKRR